MKDKCSGMENMMPESIRRWIREILLTFCMVTTGSVLVSAAYIKVFWPGDPQVSVDILWQLPLIAFACCLGNFFYARREVGRTSILCWKFLHYLYINVVVLGGGYHFGWIERGNLPMLAVMVFGILIVFAVVSAVVWNWHKKETQRLNSKLQEYQAGGGRTV